MWTDSKFGSNKGENLHEIPKMWTECGQMPKLIKKRKIEKNLYVGIRELKTSNKYTMQCKLPHQNYSKFFVLREVAKDEKLTKREEAKIDFEAQQRFEELKTKISKGLPLTKVRLIDLTNAYLKYMETAIRRNKRLSKRELNKNGARTWKGTLINKSIFDLEAGNVRNSIIPFLEKSKFGELDVHDVRKSHFDEYRVFIDKNGGANSSKNKRQTSLNHILNWGIKDKYIDEDFVIPKHHVFKIDYGIKRENILTPEIYIAMCEQAKTNINNANKDLSLKGYRSLFYYWLLYQANVGHRTWRGKADQNIPKWNDISPRTWQTTDKPITIRRESEKGHQPYQAITTPNLRKYLNRIQKIYDVWEIKPKHIFAHLSNRRGTKKGSPILSFAKAFGDLQRQLDIVDKDKRPIFSPTSLRHFFITQRMYSEKMDLVGGAYLTFAKQCGTTPRMIELVYTAIRQDQSYEQIMKGTLARDHEIDLFDINGFLIDSHAKRGGKAHIEAYENAPKHNEKP